MRKLQLTLALSILVFSLSAQKEGNIWYFGYGFGLDFNNGAPIALFDGAMQTFEGCASRCDIDGNLLFYSNGGGRTSSPANISSGTIWNSNNGLMYDMQGLEGGGYSAAQSSVILPSPENANQYYLFTMEENEFDIDGIPVGQEQGRGLSYFKIDMSLNGGLGSVITADENLHVPTYESLAATVHGNGTDYWVVIVDNNTLDFFVYQVNDSGVTNPILRPRNTNSNFSYPIKISPKGNRLTEAGVLYNFNRNTGVISSPRNLLNLNVYSVSFSPNSRYLYFGEQGVDKIILTRFDTESSDIASSREVIDSLENSVGGLMQLAPDGKIYWVSYEIDDPQNARINTIDCPNSSDPSLIKNVFTFAWNNSIFPPFLGLPNFTDNIFQNEISQEVDLGEDMVLDCITGPIVLDAGNEGATYLWSTGATSQTITVTQADTYSVTVTTECGMISDEVVITDDNPVPNIVIAGETSVCPGGSTTLTGASNEEVNYLWSTGNTSNSIEILSPGLYSLTVTDLCDAFNVDSVEVLFLDQESIEIVGPAAVCEGESIQLTAFSPGAISYTWSNGNTAASTEINSGGTYGLSVTNACEEIDTIISIGESPRPTVEIISNSTLCPGDDKTLELNAENVANYNWSNGFSSPSITAREWGWYIIEASNDCGITADSLLLTPTGCDNCIYIPNAFSPNDDGRNDLFTPVVVCPLEDYHLQVFSRWGTLVYESTEQGVGWNGHFKNEPMNPDLFIWQLQYKQAGHEFIKEGDLLLVR